MNTPNFNLKHILVIDDEPDVRDYLTLEIEDHYKDVNIVTAEDGSAGLIKAQNQKFDVVITDLRMPNLSGSSVVKHLGRLPEKLRPDKVIVFSGFIDDSTQSLAKTNPNLSFLSKPVNIDLIIQYLDEVLYKNKKKAQKQKMEVQFINPFIDGTIDVLGLLCGTIPELKEKSVRHPEDKIASDISSIIYMNSDLFMGSMAVGFEGDTYKNLYKEMTGEGIGDIDNKNCDGAGEICNQIFGYAKSKLNQKGFNIEMAIPTISYGPGHKVKHLINGPCLRLCFISGAGPFFLEVTVKSS